MYGGRTDLSGLLFGYCDICRDHGGFCLDLAGVCGVFGHWSILFFVWKAASGILPGMAALVCAGGGACHRDLHQQLDPQTADPYGGTDESEEDCAAGRRGGTATLTPF